MKPEKPKAPSPVKKGKSKEQNLQIIRTAIEEMPEYEKTLNHSLNQSGKEEKLDIEAASASKETEEVKEEGGEENDANVEVENKKVDGGDEDDDDMGAGGDNEENMHLVIDPKVFDDLDWEVECTSDVWKTLQNKKVKTATKEKIIDTVQRLASGEWSKALCKKLKGAPDTMQLYEAKLARDSRLIWELAIAFSPVKSETAERRLGVERVGAHGAKGGRVYTEIIRVWEIVLAHDHISRSVERISKSHKRGQDSIVFKKLKGIENRSFKSQNFVEKRYPKLFTEKDDPVIADVVEKAQDFFPPASSKETEYHIMKFYSFTSALVNNVLHEQAKKVDFPFKVTDLEHAIINLHPRPPCSLLLLGRSGTGKTTCCLYRLWSSFITYWNQSASVEYEPLLPRTITFIGQKRKREDSKREDDDEEGEGREDGVTLLDDLIARKKEEEEKKLAEEEKQIKDDQQKKRHDSTKTHHTRYTKRNDSTNDEDDEINEKESEDKNQDHEDDDEIDNQVKIQYDHLQQIFITKNAVLCSEVQKTFRELSHAHASASKHVEVEELPLPASLQKAHDSAFPLFITSKQFLMLLDGSLPGNTFFQYTEDGTLAKEIPGWNRDDSSQLTFLPSMDDDDSDDDEGDGDNSDGEAEEAESMFGDTGVNGGAAGARPKTKKDPRKYVSYEVNTYSCFIRS